MILDTELRTLCTVYMMLGSHLTYNRTVVGLTMNGVGNEETRENQLKSFHFSLGTETMIGLTDRTESEWVVGCDTMLHNAGAQTTNNERKLWRGIFVADSDNSDILSCDII